MKDQEHLCRPDPNSLDLGKFANHLFVREKLQLTKQKSPTVYLFGKVDHVGNLLPRKTSTAKHLRISFEDRPRFRLAEGFGETFVGLFRSLDR